ncbi:MAG: hypothetical protein AB7O88_19685 [Reyranellaceae bacterium]
MLADSLHLRPVDDRDVLDPVDVVDPHQTLRRELLDHRANVIAADLVAGKHLHADGARPQRLHTAVIGKVPQTNEQQTRHRLAVDDGLHGPEVG